MSGRGWETGLAVLVLLVGTRMSAQSTAIPELPLTLNGSVTFGYDGGAGNFGAGSNGLDLGINADLNGYYHDPRFLKFSVMPNFRWDHNDNGLLGTSDNNEGLSSSFQFFTGTSMPLSFNFSYTVLHSAALNSGPDAVSLGASGSGTNYGLTWAYNPRSRGLPSLALGYSWGASSTELAGEQGAEIVNHYSSASAYVNYSLFKFKLFGEYLWYRTTLDTPDVLDLGVPTANKTNQSTETLGVNRVFPLNTTLDARASHTDTASNLFSTPLDLGYDSATVNVNSAPFKRLMFHFGGSYISNVAAQVTSEIVSPATASSPAVTVPVVVQGAGRAVDYNGSVAFAVGHGLNAQAGVDDSEENIEGETVQARSLTVGVNYAHRLFSGIIFGTYTVGDSATSAVVSGVTSPTTTAVQHSGSVGYVRRFSGWGIQSNFSYALGGSGTANYGLVAVSQSMSGNLRARTRLRHYWDVTVGGEYSRNTVTLLTPTVGSSYDIFGSLARGAFALSVQEQRGNGYSMETTAGLTSISVAAAASGLVKAYNTDTSGLSISGSYTRRRLLFTCGYYSNGLNVLDLGALPVLTTTSNLEAKVDYRLRKIVVQGGYRRYGQASTNNQLNLGTQSWWFSIVRQFRAF